MELISHSSGGWKSEIRVPAWLGYGEGPFLNCKLLTSCFILTWQKELAGSLASFYKGTDPIHENSTFMT